MSVLGSSRGGSWTTLNFLTVAQGIVSSNEGHGRCSQVLLGCHAVHDGMVLLLGGDGDVLAVSGCSVCCQWWPCLSAAWW